MLEMNRTDKPVNPAHHKDSGGPSLKGAFVSVMLLGGFLALTWFTVFSLFLARN